MTSPGSTYSNGLGKWLQDADANGDQTFDAILDRFGQALFDGLSPLNGELFGFVVPDYDEFGALQYDDNGKLVHEAAAESRRYRVDAFHQWPADV